MDAAAAPRRSLARAALASAKGRFVLAALALYVVYQLWLTLAAPGKIAPELSREAPRLNLLVTLPFPPERFHIIVFQRYGRVSGTQDNAVEVRGVKGADLTALARPYWVKRIEPLPADS